MYCFRFLTDFFKNTLHSFNYDFLYTPSTSNFAVFSFFSLDLPTIVLMFPLDSSTEVSGTSCLVSRTLVLVLFVSLCNDNLPLFARTCLLTISASGLKQTFIWSSNHVSITNKSFVNL